MEFSADLDQLQPMLTYISFEARHAGFADEEVSRIQLASEEALVNIIRHAGVGEMEIRCHSSAIHQLEIRIFDHGCPFNPLEGGEIDPTLPLEEREPGGLGLHMIRTLMDEVTYHREGDTNILTLIKRT